MNDHDLDIAHDLEITKTVRRKHASGTWVIGKLGGHGFEALVFPEHAESPDFELGESRISKLWIRCEETGLTVCNFDRGWDVRPTTKMAQAIADFLAAGLAEHTFGK